MNKDGCTKTILNKWPVAFFVNKSMRTIQYEDGYFPNRRHRLRKFKGSPWATATEEVKLQICEACSRSHLSHSPFTRALYNSMFLSMLLYDMFLNAPIGKRGSGAGGLGLGLVRDVGCFMHWWVLSRAVGSHSGTVMTPVMSPLEENARMTSFGIGKFAISDFSMAVIQVNQVVEDHFLCQALSNDKLKRIDHSIFYLYLLVSSFFIFPLFHLFLFSLWKWGDDFIDRV